MTFAYYAHSLRSDWNHGNAHFLRGLLAELRRRGHEVRAFEPEEPWSLVRLREDLGPEAERAYLDAYPGLTSDTYRTPEEAVAGLDGVDVALVHEWNDPEIVAALGARRPSGTRMLFHDTHHRAASAPAEMARYDLGGYDGVLAFGDVVRDLYLRHGWARRAWTWHEAADPELFRPHPEIAPERDLVWVGNWGDDERAAELREFLIEPVRRLGLSARIHGVRYPDAARRALDEAGIEYAGYLPNHEAPLAFARARVTVHVPRGPYVRALPGIPTIRPFEALAGGIPLMSAPWEDAEGLFRPGEDFLFAWDGGEMERRLRVLLGDEGLRRGLAARGRETLLARHTVGHRADELMGILREI